MDAISKLFDEFFDWVAGLAQIHFSFLLRAMLLFGLPCLFCGWAFARGNRAVLGQSSFAAGLLLAAAIPVDKLIVGNRLLRGWLLLLGSTLLLFLPSSLPALVLPTEGLQKRSRGGWSQLHFTR